MIRIVQSHLAGEGTLKGFSRQHGIYHSLLRLWVGKHHAVDHLRSRGIYVVEGCRAMSLSRSTFYKKAHEEIRRLREESRTTLRAAIEEIVEEWPAYGYRRVTQELRRRGTVAPTTSGLPGSCERISESP